MIQIEMEMAEKCSECRFQTDYYFCSAMPKNFCGNTSDEGKPDWCPLKNADGWISVKDRLPEEQIPVLVYVPPYSNENEKYTEYVGVAYYMYSAISGYWAGTDGNVYGAIGIIHDPIYWMPLPEPPKEETDGNRK